jgi:hypothetical protein
LYSAGERAAIIGQPALMPLAALPNQYLLPCSAQNPHYLLVIVKKKSNLAFFIF